MKKKSIYTLTVLIASMFLTVQVMAADGGIQFKANGQLTAYSNYDDPERGSEIVGGTWNVVIKDGVVNFKYLYNELNIREELEYSPEGSVDQFIGELAEGATYAMKIDHVQIWGEIHIDKKMWFLDDYSSNPLPPWFDPDWVPENAPVAWIEDFIVRDVHIVITPYYIRIENGNLDKLGTTLVFLH